MVRLLLYRSRLLLLEQYLKDVILPEVFRSLIPVIEDKIIEQLRRGESGDGKKLPDYGRASVEIYGKQPGPMTLEDTGSFHMGITVEVTPEGVRIYGKDSKTPMLIFDYGSAILTLQERSILELKQDYLSEEVGKRIQMFLTYGT